MLCAAALYNGSDQIFADTMKSHTIEFFILMIINNINSCSISMKLSDIKFLIIAIVMIKVMIVKSIL